MKWTVFFASAAGKHHLANNVPCQDCGHHVVVDDVFIGAVCDGAGSASEGLLGAQLFATQVTAHLAQAVRAGRFAAGAAPGCAALVLDALQEARAHVGAAAASRGLELKDFACTLVGCISSPSGGCFFHVGDGFAVFREDAQTGASVLSRPENGEYADETFFVTDESWKDHLRITAIPAARHGGLIGLMSDGASPFAIDRPKTGFYRPFIDPVVAFLSKASEHNGNQALQNLLHDEKTLEITADDKALLLALAV